jgi:hypothetical protein
MPCLGGETVLADQEGRFNDEPSLVRTADGSIYVAWNGFRDGADEVMVARYEFSGVEWRHLATWRAAGGKGSYILNPKAVTAGKGIYVLYAAERNGQWDVYAVPCGPEGPGRPLALTADPAADVKPDGAWHNGTLWVAWESNRGGGRQALLSGFRNGQRLPVEVVSASGKSNYGPSLAVRPNGAVAVAWHSFRNGNYDIYLRERSASGAWGQEARLTRAATIDRHPILHLQKDDLWLLYENAQMKAYRTGATPQRRVIAARLTPQGLEAPTGYRDACPLWNRAENATPALDELGRLWIAYLVPRLPRAGWEVRLTGYNGETWHAPLAPSSRKGMDRRPGLLVIGKTALLAYQVDDFPETWMHNKPEATANARSTIMLAAVDIRQAVPPARAKLEPLVEPGEPFETADLRLARGEDLQAPTVEYRGKKLKLFYGDLHTHSDISVCNRCTDQSVDENYQVRRDVNRLDFAGMTDHDYNFVPYLWNYTAKMARANEDPGRMMTFLAMEWTSSFEKYDEKNPYGYYGHRNLVFADPYFPKWWNANLGMTPADVWNELRQMKANFVHIPHQLADEGNVPTDWSYVDQKAQPVAEIFQNRGSYEYHGAPRPAIRAVPKPGWYLQDVWARGTVIGVIASPDHGGGGGKAAVYAEDLTRQAILDAIRARRTFGTTAARIFLDVRVNGLIMGETGSESGGKPVQVKIRVRCPQDIDRIEVCRNNRFVYASQPEKREADLTFLDNEPLAGYSYYYVRVMQKDGEMAWSSPVWLGAK